MKAAARQHGRVRLAGTGASYWQLLVGAADFVM